MRSARAVECLAELKRLRTVGYSGDCWGYPFDWEARYGRLAGTPTIVATGIVTNSLFIAHRVLELEEALEMCVSAARFVLVDLSRSEEEDDTFCWGYYPGDTQRVLNATMKGARLCAQMYSVTGDDSYLEPARRTATYVARHQRSDGAWPYAVGDARGGRTTFTRPTSSTRSTPTSAARVTTASTTCSRWKYYRDNFFVDDRIPKYYADKPFPIDATACAQSLLTLCRFGDIHTAIDVADLRVRTMHRSRGPLAYQVRRRRVVPNSLHAVGPRLCTSR